MSQYIHYPNLRVPTYATFGAFPALALNGDLAIDLATSNLYEFNGTMWVLIGGPGSISALGALDGQAPTANGASVVSGTLYMQSASATFPGLVNNTTQTFSGNKTFTGTIVASNLSGTNTGDVTIGTANGLSILGQVLSLGLSSTSTTGALSDTDWDTFNNKQPAGSYITDLTGDATATGPGSAVLTLATVNGNVGSFGSSTSIPSFTVNAKGLITAASGNVVIAPAGTLTGTTLAANVVSSSLTSVGTITSGTWNGTTLAIANGGTGQITASAAFDALSPMTTGGDLIYGGASGTGTRLPNGTAGQMLTSGGGTAAPSWTTPTTGTVTSVALTVPAASIFSVTGSPITTSGTLDIATTGTSGGIPYFSSTTALSSSALLAANQLVLGGGAGTAPSTLGTLGTTTTVLHGNAGGAPTFGAVVLTTDVSGTLPITNGGTGQTTAAAAFGAFSPLTTKGDLLGFSTVNARVPIGTNGQVLTADSAETLGLKWATPGNIGVGTYTTTATIATTDGLSLADSAGGAYVLTLPAIGAGDVGKVLEIQKTTADFNAITIDGDGSDTVGVGASTTINTIGERVRLIVATATSWAIVARDIPSEWTAYTPTFTGFGTVTNIEVLYRRSRDSAELRAKWINGTPSATEARMSLPSALTSSGTGKIPSLQVAGTLYNTNQTVNNYYPLIEPSVTYITFGIATVGVAGLAKQNGNAIFNTTETESLFALVPIDGWNG